MPKGATLDQIVPDVLEKGEWDLVQLAAAASTLAGVQRNINDAELGVKLWQILALCKGLLFGFGSLSMAVNVALLHSAAPLSRQTKMGSTICGRT